MVGKSRKQKGVDCLGWWRIECFRFVWPSTWVPCNLLAAFQKALVLETYYIAWEFPGLHFVAKWQVKLAGKDVLDLGSQYNNTTCPRID